jgi:hypothetical protein
MMSAAINCGILALEVGCTEAGDGEVEQGTIAGNINSSTRFDPQQSANRLTGLILQGSRRNDFHALVING